MGHPQASFALVDPDLRTLSGEQENREDVNQPPGKSTGPNGPAVTVGKWEADLGSPLLIC